MIVAINTFPLNSGHQQRGIGFYTKYLTEGLKNISRVEIVEFGDLSQLEGVDLVHYPYFDLFKATLPINKKFPTVVTIHDVTPLIFPQHYPSGLRGKLNFYKQKYALRSVAAVITDSQSSKKDIEKYLGVSKEKIFTVRLAAGSNFKKISDKKVLDGVRDKFGLPPKFALFVGNINWNKNILNLTQACLDANIDICLIGKDFLKRENLNHPELRSFSQFIEKYSGNPKVHILGFVEDDDLVKIINLAEVLLLPSFYEGFGLPILEAQACGTPVITSNISSMSEVAGEGALLVDPYDIDKISKGIEKINTNNIFRKDLVQKGFDNVKRFSWEKTAQETVKVYAQVLKI